MTPEPEEPTCDHLKKFVVHQYTPKGKRARDLHVYLRCTRPPNHEGKTHKHHQMRSWKDDWTDGWIDEAVDDDEVLD